MKARLKRGFKHYDEEGDLMRPGTVVEMTELRFQALSDRFERVVKRDDEVPPESPVDEGWERALREQPYHAIVETIRDMDDPEEIAKARVAEMAEKGRVTVLRACEERLKELGEEPAD